MNEVPNAETGVTKSFSEVSEPLIRVMHPVFVNKALVTETHSLVWRQ
jgi:hypothetical protein